MTKAHPVFAALQEPTTIESGAQPTVADAARAVERAAAAAVKANAELAEAQKILDAMQNSARMRQAELINARKLLASLLDNLGA